MVMSWLSRLLGRSRRGRFAKAFKAWHSVWYSSQPGIDREVARKLFRDALAKEPGSWVGHFGMGAFLSDMERLGAKAGGTKSRRPVADAVECLRKALKLNPAAAEPHLVLAAQFAASDPAAAAAHLAAATAPAARIDESIYPRRLQADDYWDAAVGLAAGDRREPAVAAFRRAIELNPRFADQTPDGAKVVDGFADAAFDLLPGRAGFGDEETRLWRLWLRRDRQALRHAGVPGAAFVARRAGARFPDLAPELLEVGVAVIPAAVVELGCIKTNESEVTAGDRFITALGQARDPRVVGALVAIVNGRPTGQSNYGNSRLRLVVETLGPVGDVQAVKPLVGLLNPNERNDNHSVSVAAANSLEAIVRRHPRELPGALLAELADLSLSVRTEEMTAERGRDDEFTYSVDFGVDVSKVKRLAQVELARRGNPTAADLQEWERVFTIPPATAQLAPCAHCKGSGACYCKRKGLADTASCARCQGSEKCHVCQGTGRQGQ
ncbi:MAG: hypothetical protein C0501_21810 [Isosphaera sp.]|nr:hypothetical protein [Isosphaera sp.]